MTVETNPDSRQGPAGLEVKKDQDGDVLVLSGALTCNSVSAIWDRAAQAISGSQGKQVSVDVSAVSYMDGFGGGLLLDLKRRAAGIGVDLSLVGMNADTEALLKPFDPENYQAKSFETAKSASLLESIGQNTRGVFADLISFCEFTGEVSRALVFATFHPSTIRWKDVYQTAVKAGADAIPVIMLVGFLIGFVMAFQSAIPMRQFGADIFIPSLVGIAMLRELGPIMTAVGLAGRSGAAFAAEIGTMKVNEEVNALITLGLPPVRFLIVPRIIAAVLVTPFLIVFANVAGLLGGLIVFVSIGFPMGMYFDQLQQFIDTGDLFSGIFKGFAFGFVVAAVGCMKGLQTTTGASAVGSSTTSAVVTSIVLVAIGDGLFAVVYYFLGI